MKEKPQKSIQELWENSHLSGVNAEYLENLYNNYLQNPNDVLPDWRNYFDMLSTDNFNISHKDIQNFHTQFTKETQPKIELLNNIEYCYKQEKVIDLISAYRQLGHLQANINPLKPSIAFAHPALDLSYYNLTDLDLNTHFNVGSFKGLSKSSATLKEILEQLRKIYCDTIGIEYMHISQIDEMLWIQQYIEQKWPYFTPTKEEKFHLLELLIATDTFEKYLGNKYVGQKRFSLEGGDSLIPMIDTILHYGRQNGIDEIIIGMAHRGRLNVLVNIFGKEPTKICAEFEGKDFDISSSGDVKYHLGFSANIKSKYGPIHVALAFNPSHLEIVSPVVQGSVRARQRRRKDSQFTQVMPIQIHGDAAFSGQGVVMETFSMSRTRWFTVGGSIHIVINNQIGFTTHNPQDARSSLYCTDIAKMINAPILHVNSNDPEAVMFVSQLAIEYRKKFKKDIIIDLVCYRRHGHNEADEPSATQPLMYKIIKSLPTSASIYAQKLISERIINNKTEQEITDRFRNRFETGQSVVELTHDKNTYPFSSSWDSFFNNEWTVNYNTRLSKEKLISLSKSLDKIPEGFHVQTQVRKTLDARQKMTQGEIPVNWGYAEILAYATLLDEGYSIRLCGQDTGRGTFAHRHAILRDQTNDSIYIPLNHVSENQARINIVDSLLSEEGVLAFEYGYAATEPNHLVIWEAQFGDFANGAQVVIDQFISSGEQKWGRLCGLVMFLPHGYEGQGPEHSSARLERYLQLCAQKNIQVCVPTTPSQMYHLLRRQMLRSYRKPLIVMTPKSLLRHPMVTSHLGELAHGEFQPIIPEIDSIDPMNIERVVMCCGKVYYDLIEKRRELNLTNIAILRIEQLYPFPEDHLKQILLPYKKATRFIWCQEEPKNQGAWYCSQHHLINCLGKSSTLNYAGRPASASPATGYSTVHINEQEKLVISALME
ncbi:TPA: 2-oxoglutarate dehydrogenase E1 component [Legionella pneumophila]